VDAEGWIEPFNPRSVTSFYDRNVTGIAARGDSPERKAENERDIQARTDYALSIWDECLPLKGSPVENYLVSRGISPCDDLRAADALRYHASLKHPTDGLMPAMVALFRDVQTDKPCAIHRTFIPGGRKHGKPLMLGPSKGAAIMLSPSEEVSHGLGICEGIETAVSIAQTGWRPLWVVGSAGGIESFPPLGGLECLTVFADHDENGTCQRAASACRDRLSPHNIDVEAVMPRTAGLDWNDTFQNLKDAA